MTSVLIPIIAVLLVICLLLVWLSFVERKENRILTRYIMDLKSPESLVRARVDQKRPSKKELEENMRSISVENTYQDVMKKGTITGDEKKILETEKLLK